MLDIKKFTLENGLRIIVNEDFSTPFSVMNILYDVGSKDEDPEKTGFAHLFEHLMFGGSVNIPIYDIPLQRVGGENNAFTNTDITNYHITLPTENIETAFWLESDRMLNLDFSQKNLDTQKNVVIEEFKQRYLNKPYGDVWLYLRPLSYKVHPYQWPTIGKEISHIQKATLNDVKDFFYAHYAPNNAIMVLSGSVTFETVKQLSEKWFAPIPTRNVIPRNLPKEPEQKEHRRLTIERNVPFDSIYLTFHMCDRMDKNYHASDLISDILSNGKSSRLYQNLVQKKKLFSEINAYISGEMDEGLFIFSGNLMKGVPLITAEKAIWDEIEKLKNGYVFEYELVKVRKKK
ncbi:MAG: insulinase family protein [Bacteroidales bacterium]|nr:insulinase family protein [Bacteroidales bacterium]